MDLETFFRENRKAALAFSGGVDSSYLMYAGNRYGADLGVYYVKSVFQPQFEMDDALRLASELGIKVNVIKADVLKDETVRANPKDRCYYCKKMIFNAIAKAANEDGYTLLLDGTNASDAEDDRPGMKALRELKVRSPLRECGLVKSEIRRLSKEAGLFTWDKPAYACLATRIRTGEEITEEKLGAVEASEDFLFSLGFTDFRVRRTGNTAKIQIKEDQFDRLIAIKDKIRTEFMKYYDAVTLDLEGR